MKKKETKKLTKDEILKNLEKSKKDLFNFRFQKINGQMMEKKIILMAVPLEDLIMKKLKEKSTLNQE